MDLHFLVNLLLDTLPMLGNVLLLCFFVFFIFGIVGVQLWAGLLRYVLAFCSHYSIIHSTLTDHRHTTFLVQRSMRTSLTEAEPVRQRLRGDLSGRFVGEVGTKSEKALIVYNYRECVNHAFQVLHSTGHITRLHLQPIGCFR